MKKIIYFLILTSFSFYAQKKEKIVFLFDQNKDSIILKNNYRIYTIGNNQTFKYSVKKHKEINVTYEKIKKQVVSTHDFLKKNKFKKDPKYYNEYLFYIFIRNNYKSGCLVEVEKIWLVESKIAD
jgi:hypothetical protein